MTKRFEIVDDYLVCYDGDCFDLHKPSDIRSLVNVIGYVTDENEQLRELLENGLEVSQVEIDEELERMNKNE